MDKIRELWNALGRRRQIQIAVLAVAIVVVLVIIVATALLKGDRSIEVAAQGDVEKTTASTTFTTKAAATEITTEAEELSLDFFSPFTHLPVSEEEYAAFADRRALLVSYDNIHYAWPQAGVTYADFTVEILAEGLITRLLGVFFTTPPEYVGPIRSARPYIVVKAQEFDAYLAHVGGSQQALADIVNYDIADLDGLWSGAFNRQPHKNPPHNTYASYEDLLYEAERQGYRSSGRTDFYSFDADIPAGALEDANHLVFEYRQPYAYGDGGYKVEYYYDDNTNLYTRHINGEAHLDEVDGNPFAVSNIVVQYANHEVLDAEGRLAIDLFSGGEAYQFRDGKAYELTWSKDERGSLTDFVYNDGSKVLLTPGKTAFMVVYPGIFEYENLEGESVDD